MPRLLAVGHVTRDRLPQGDVLGGSVSYAALTARRLGWEAAVATAAGEDFDPSLELPGVPAFVTPSRTTTRFSNEYAGDGTRQQMVLSRACDVELTLVAEAWREPDVLLLSPVIGEVPAGTARGFEASVVGAIAQGFLRAVAPDGLVSPKAWERPAEDLAGVHVLFLSQHDLPDALSGGATALLAHVPIVVVTLGWKGCLVLTRETALTVPTWPRPETDPTGAGDVFAASFLLRYHEAGDLAEASAFAGCAASCAVEGIGTSSLGDRPEILRRMVQRERLIEEGEWDE